MKQRFPHRCVRSLIPILGLILPATAAVQAQTEFQGLIAQSAENDYRRSLVRVELGSQASAVVLKKRYLSGVHMEEKAEYRGVVIDPRGFILVHAAGFKVFEKDPETLKAAILTGRQKYLPASVVGVDMRTELVLLQNDEFQGRDLELADSLKSPQLFFVSSPDDHWRIETHRVLSLHPEKSLPEWTLELDPADMQGSGQRLIGSFVLDGKGRLAGMITRLKADLSSRKKAVYRALPAEVLLDASRRIAETRRNIAGGWLGIWMDNAPGRIWVTKVEHHSPADKAGLKPKDVLIAVAGRPVECLDDLGAAIRWKGPGGRLDLKVVRAGEVHRLLAVLQERPLAGSVWAVDIPEKAPSPEELRYYKTDMSVTPHLGVILEPLNAETASEFKVPTDKGLLIRDLVSNSPAARFFRAGDAVIRVNDRRLCCTSELHKALQELKGGKLVIEYYRQGRLRVLQVRPEDLGLPRQ